MLSTGLAFARSTAAPWWWSTSASYKVLYLDKASRLVHDASLCWIEARKHWEGWWLQSWRSILKGHHKCSWRLQNGTASASSTKPVWARDGEMLISARIAQMPYPVFLGFGNGTVARLYTSDRHGHSSAHMFFLNINCRIILTFYLRGHSLTKKELLKYLCYHTIDFSNYKLSFTFSPAWRVITRISRWWNMGVLVDGCTFLVTSCTSTVVLKCLVTNTSH